VNLQRYDVIRRIAGPRSFSQWVFVPILMTLTVGTWIPELQAGSPFYAEWRSVAITALLVSWGFATGMGLLVNAVLPKPTVPRFVAVILVFFVTEAGRTVLVALQAQAMGLDTDPNWPYRIVAGGLTGWALFGLAAYLANEAEQYRATLGQLTQTQALLGELVSATQSDLEVRRVQLLEQVRTAVTESIRSVLSSGGSSAREVADDLVRVSEDVVRPLSHSLIPEREANPVIREPSTPRISISAVLNYATYVQPFRPVAVTLFTVLMVAGAVIFLWPIEVLPAFIALLGWVFGFLGLMSWTVTPRLKTMRVPWRVITLSVAYLGSATVPGVFVMFATNTLKPEGWPYLVYIFLIAQIVLWPLAIIAGVDQARADVIDKIRQSNQRLLWSRARLSSHLWGQQSTIAVALHKDVQGTLLAAAMKLKISRDAGKTDADAIDEIRAAVLEAAEFVVAPSDAVPLMEAVASINSRWQGVFRVDVDDSTEAIARLDADSVCRRIVIDMLAEFVTNAVKHGQATSARVSLTLASDDVLLVQGVNNGRSLAATLGSGLGTRMLEAVSLDQGFENVPGGVRVWAEIPIV
jgi:signal transduction histidine kinase